MCADLGLGPRAWICTRHTPRHAFPRPQAALSTPRPALQCQPHQTCLIRPSNWWGGGWGVGGKNLSHHSQAVPMAQQLSFQVIPRYPYVYLPWPPVTSGQDCPKGFCLCLAALLNPGPLAVASPMSSSAHPLTVPLPESLPLPNDGTFWNSISQCPSPRAHSHMAWKP